MSKPSIEALHELGGRSLSAEARLVLCTAGGAEADDAIDFLIGEIANWPRLLELSVLEGAQPVLGTRLRTLSRGRIPDDILRALDHLERIASIRQRYLQLRMLDALAVLSNAGIPVTLLKGAALVHTTYASFLERPMSDVDLLVDGERAAEAQRLLRGAGWVQRYDAKFDGFYATMHHLPPLIDSRAPSMNVGLEIHTAIVQRDRDPFAFPPERIRPSAIPVEGLPAGTHVPSVVHRLLHCCIHFAWSHKASKGAWRTFRDVSAMLSNEQVDWTEFVGEARVTRARAACYWTMRLAKSLVCAPVPDNVLRELRPRGPEALLAIMERHFSHGVMESERVCPSERLQSAVWTAAFRPDRDADGRQLPWKGEDREWRLLRGVAAPDASAAGSRIVLRPRAWLRYLASIAGITMDRFVSQSDVAAPAPVRQSAPLPSRSIDAFPTPPASARFL